MRIINAMFCKNLGGIQQAFLNYSKVLHSLGHKVTVIILPNSEIKKYISEIGDINIIEVNNRGNWDLLARHALKTIIKQIQPDIIISHTSRAAKMIGSVSNGTKNIGVLHNYSMKRFSKMTHLIAVSNDLKNKAHLLGWDQDKVFYIPNMIELNSSYKWSEFKELPIIGTIGRFVAKKGFDSFIRAMAILKNRGIKFKAIIGGNGDESANLELLRNNLDLKEEVEFVGWVENKENFYKKIDVFCLPSLHEPFGIVLLEALKYGLPIVTTNTEGPLEIIKDKEDCLVIAKNDENAMAEAISKLLSNRELARNLANNALETVKKYDINEVTKTIDIVLKQVASN